MTVSNDLLSIPLSKTRYYDRSFAIQGAKQWNSLPTDIRHAHSLTSFKHKVKMHLLSIYFIIHVHTQLVVSCPTGSAVYFFRVLNSIKHFICVSETT